MAVSKFSHVKITGIEYVIPNNICRNVDNYLHFFDNNPKKLERAKKMIGYGNIYKAPEEKLITRPNYVSKLNPHRQRRTKWKN